MFGMTLRFDAFNFFERELKKINFHFCYTHSLSSFLSLSFTLTIFLAFFPCRDSINGRVTFCPLNRNICTKIGTFLGLHNKQQQQNALRTGTEFADGIKVWTIKMLKFVNLANIRMAAVSSGFFRTKSMNCEIHKFNMEVFVPIYINNLSRPHGAKRGSKRLVRTDGQIFI